MKTMHEHNRTVSVNDPEKSRSSKDRWDKWGIILKPAGGLFTALAVAALGYFGNDLLQEQQARQNELVERRQSEEMSVRLYTELITRREEAESSLRKDMFRSIIESFLKSDTATLDARILQLELLAYNFHESLNLEPLFVYFEKQILDSARSSPNVKREYLERLHKVAREITRKQLAALKGAGDIRAMPVNLAPLIDRRVGRIELGDFNLEVDSVTRHFVVTSLGADTVKKEIKMRLEITRPGDPTDEVEAEFWVGFFDFPMIDNTRLTDDQRCSIVLNRFSGTWAHLSVVFFPGSHASLKEKPYYQEVVKQLLPAKGA